MRKLVLALTAVFLTVSSPGGGAAEPQPATVHLQIPAQPLRDALSEFGRQSGLQVVFLLTDVAETLMSPPLTGDYSHQVALERLLANTPLNYEFLNARIVAIRNVKTAVVAPADKSAQVAESMNPLRLAQAEAPADQETQPREEPIKRDAAGIPEILVEGKRSLNADIQRTEDDSQPYVVFGAEEIERSQVNNIEDFLKTRLPMNALRDSNNQQKFGTQFGNQSQIDLRGLGTNQTLVLVDGRRLPGVSHLYSFDSNQPDINGIPLSAVERIEVLPSTASGIYGGGATGGAVNIILKRDYQGLDIRMAYDGTFEGDAAQRRTDVTGGFALEGGRTQVIVTGSYTESDPLLAGDRDFERRARSMLLARDPDRLYNSFFPPRGYTTNIKSMDDSDLVLKTGEELGSPRTFVPVGYAGPESDDGLAFLDNAGEYNFDLSDDYSGLRRSLRNNPTVISFAFNVRRQFSDRVEVFADLHELKNRGRFHTGSFDGFIFLEPSAPNNPFTTDIVATIPSPHLKFVRTSDAESRRAAGGVIVRLPRDWMAEADYNWNRSRYHSTSTNPFINIDAVLGLHSGTLFDVMRDINALPLDFTGYLLDSPNNIVGPFDTTLDDAMLRVAGPLMSIPGGRVAVTGMIEYRREKAHDAFFDRLDYVEDPDAPSGVSEATVVQFTPARWQTVDSYYLEARFPLVSSANAFTGVRDLELQASVRHDDYATTSVQLAEFGAFIMPSGSREGPLPDVPRGTKTLQSTDFTLGLRYAPLRDLVLRTSFGTGFLPPSISQVVETPVMQDFGVGLVDPKRSNVFEFLPDIDVKEGGNAGLLPEQSESWSAGMIFTPQRLPGFRLSVDFTQIEKSDEISLLTTDVIFADEEALGRVVRAPLSDGDIALGYTGGAITVIDFSYANIAKTKVAAYDIQADYTLETAHGSFRFSALATLTDQFKRQITAASPSPNTVGFDNGPVDWRANTSVTWDSGPWTLSWNMQYYDSYFVYPAGVDPERIAEESAVQGSASIPVQTYHDLFARYRFPADAAVSLGIQNVLDKEPPIVVRNGSLSGYGDPRLRRFSLTLQKSF